MSPEEIETKIAVMQRQIARLTQKLDECRRRVNLSGLIDEQTAAIDARVNERA